MVVSGLPVRNGDKHAGEIGLMALNLLSSIKDFTIPHITNKKIQLRIGIHSGIKLSVILWPEQFVIIWFLLNKAYTRLCIGIYVLTRYKLLKKKKKSKQSYI